MCYGSKKFYILLLSLLVILCIVYYCSLTDERYRNSKISKERKRMRDFINHPVYEDENTVPPAVNNIKPRVTVFKTSDKKKRTKTLCVDLTTPRGNTPICIFDPSMDTMISAYVKDFGTWEPDLLNETGYILRQKPHLTFLDVGCNIGTFTLYLAKQGVRVIAIDVLKPALALLEESLVKGGLLENVTLLLNAISNTRERVQVHVVKDNPGGSYIEVHVVKDNPGGSYIEQNNNKSKNFVNAITLDDLINIVGQRSVFLKMDIEGNEHKALMGASRFFQFLSVEHLLMEWAFHRHNSNGKEIIHFLLRNGMLPFEKLTTYSPLDLSRSYQWPDNIFWSKR